MYGDYLVVEDLVSVAEQNRLAKFVGSSEIPYRLYASYQHHFDELKEQLPEQQLLDPRFIDPIQLSHHVYMDEENGQEPQVASSFEKFVPLLLSLKNFFGDYKLLRMKINCGFIQPGEYLYTPQTPHVDLQYDNGDPIDHWVCLYYLDTNDAPTYFFDKELRIVKKITAQKGRAILFDGSTLHAGSNPALEPLRFVLNIVVKPAKTPTSILNVLNP